ncbi:MAG: transglutaminase family protein [Pirellulales bacterium]|nr:transglutaminase family protein [Pirellulales bacterium]
MYYRVSHETTYNYSEPVTLCQNLSHLTPRDLPEQYCWRTDLVIRPEPALRFGYNDYFGNRATFCTVQEPHRELTMIATHYVEVALRPPSEPSASVPWEEARDRLRADRSRESLEAYQFAFASRYSQPSAKLAAYAEHSFKPGANLYEAVLDLTTRIHEDFTYDPQATTVSTPLDEVFAQRRGVCQDFAHLEIACLRSLGLAARYVSGYLRTVPPPGKDALAGADATHAWLSVYDPDNGWLDVDPTNDQVVADEHILLAWGRDYDDVNPIKGVVHGGGQHTIELSVDVACLTELPNPLYA